VQTGPAEISRLVSLGLARLPQEATSLIRAAAILGDGARLKLVAGLAALDGERAARAAAVLLRADLLRSEDPVEFIRGGPLHPGHHLGAPRGAVVADGGERPSISPPSWRWGEAGGSLSRGSPGRVGAASAKPRRPGTAGWAGRGERDGRVYARNRCRYASYEADRQAFAVPVPGSCRDLRFVRVCVMVRGRAGLAPWP